MTVETLRRELISTFKNVTTRAKSVLHTRIRTVLTVLGARSGTSALAGTLGILGGTLPKNLMGSASSNTKGHFEPQDFAEMHDKILASVGSVWSDWREFPQTWFRSAEAQQYRLKLMALFLENYGDAVFSIVKEPRMCRILPLWDGVFEDLKAKPVFCFIDRDPLEVAASLRARDGSSLTDGLLYYVRNHLDAERATRTRRRTFVSYDTLLSNWPKTIRFAGEKLGIPFSISKSQESAVDSFLEPALCHQGFNIPHYPKGALYNMAYVVHEAFSGLASGGSEEPTRRRLDELRTIFNEWQAKYTDGWPNDEVL
jgi:hypothetical protein